MTRRADAEAAGLGASLPAGYRWGKDAMEQFEVGKRQATAAMVAVVDKAELEHIAEVNSLRDRALERTAEALRLRDELARITATAKMLAAELSDPGTEALAAIWCAEQALNACANSRHSPDAADAEPPQPQAPQGPAPDRPTVRRESPMNFQQISSAEAEALAGRRLDRRRRYAQREDGQLVQLIGYVDSCSGCCETSDGYNVNGFPTHPKWRCLVGAGCSECGFHGVVQHRIWIPERLANLPLANPAAELDHEACANSRHSPDAAEPETPQPQAPQGPAPDRSTVL